MLYSVIEKSSKRVVARQLLQNSDWVFLDPEFQRLFETLLIEGVARGRKNYVPGDDQFDTLFWDELSQKGYDVTTQEEKVMPKALVEKLPKEAQEIYESAYKSALETYDGDEGKAAAVAIAAVKDAGYAKDEESGEWKKTEKSEGLRVAGMYFTKASVDPETGEMRWAATVSKFGEDDQGDEVTSAFYERAIQAVEAGARPMPVLCVSHIDKGRPGDDWVAGDTTSMFIDGSLPKAKGIFRDTELGKATFTAVRKDIQEQVPQEQRARISMGFFDEGSTPKKKGGRRFERGWIKHFAVTRVPVVKETDIIVAKGGGVTTIKEDAVSIVGEDLADKLLEEHRREKGLITKQTKGEDQVRDLVEQLLAILPGVEAAGIDVEGLRRALGNKGTNAAPAEPASKSEVDTFVDEFARLVKSTLLGTGDRTEKFSAIQQGLDQFGQGVERLVKGSTPPSSQDISEAVQSAVLKAMQPLQQELLALKARLEGLSVAPPDERAQPRSMDTRPQPSAPALTAPPRRKAWKVADLAFVSTAEPRY